MTDYDDPDTHMTYRERQRAKLAESGDGARAGLFANGLGLGLVVVGFVAMAVAMFLPFAQPVDGLPVLGINTVFQLVGWYLLWPLFFIPYFGYRASQGKRSAQWGLIGFCVAAAIGVVALATAKGLRTMRIIGPGGPADSTGPGIVAGLDIAIYIAGAGVALAIVGALALLQNAHRGTGVTSTPEANPALEHAAPEAEASAEAAEVQAAGAQAHVSGTRRQPKWPLVAAILVVVVTVAGYFFLGQPGKSSQSSVASQPTTSLTPAQSALQGLLLGADQINAAMGTTVLTVLGTTGVMPDLTAQVPDTACLPIVSPVEAQVYQGSGWSTMVARAFAEPGPRFRHRVEQTVVSFPSAKEAGAFFAASAQSWPACADRKFTVVMMGTNMAHTAGAVTNTDGTLSVAQNQDGAELVFGCQRALTTANNIVVDVMACSLNPADAQYDTHPNAAIDIAHQIAAKVPAT